MQLVEIKCPYTCEDTVIVDKNEKISLVDYYLILNVDGKPQLKRSHIYYTQIQVSLYVTGLTVCQFLVFSRHNSILIEILRDDDFLKMVIPKVEYFYFHHYLPVLSNNYKELHFTHVLRVL